MAAAEAQAPAAALDGGAAAMVRARAQRARACVQSQR
jgi:hypothetical protein